MWHTLRLYAIPSSGKRADYLRKHKIFHHLGIGCTIMERKVPLYPKLISIGNNVHLASKVQLISHDAVHLCLNNLEQHLSERAYHEKIGCIQICDNVFVGSCTVILYDVRIGSNVIIGAGSVVNKDIPDNSVAVGVPAKVIGTFDDFKKKRREKPMYLNTLRTDKNFIDKKLEMRLWENFNLHR